MSIQNNQISFMEVQFFNFSSQKLIEESQCPQVQQETLIENNSSIDQQIFIESDSSKETGSSSHSSKTKSILHNFQKHLFTFIQSLIPTESPQKKSEKNEIQNCKKKILKLVKGQKKKTREELVPIFGQLNILKLNRMNQNYKALIEEFSQETLQRSLLKVRNILMQKITKVSLEGYVQRSKMEKKGEFLKYMQSFVSEVEERRFSCRLSKKSQTQIRQKINDEIKYNEWQSLIL